MIYRGLHKSSMEYMSLTHSNKQPEAAHTLKGEILISDRQHPGYIQYCITLDQEWMTRRVVLAAMFDGSPEKRLVLEVDQDQRWYKVTEGGLARSRSFFRSGAGGAAPAGAEGASPVDSQASSSFSDSASCGSNCSSYTSSSSSDLESSIQFEKINLTWSPPPKGSKRGSKRFSSINPLKDMAPASPSSPSPVSPSSSTEAAARSPVIGFVESKCLSNKSSSSSLNGSSTKTYEHLPALDGCIHLELGRDVSPTTLLLPLRRATLGIDPDEMQEHLATLMSCPSAVTSELTAMVSFPDLELRPVRTHVGYVGQGRRETLNIVEYWTDEDDENCDSTLVEVDQDGLATQYGDAWARLGFQM